MNSEHDDFKNFIKYQSLEFQNMLFHNFVGNSYHKTEEYVLNYEYLKRIINKNKSQ